MSPGARWSVAPYFIVDDVVATANYYRDKLGFHYEKFWGDPPAFAMVMRKGAVLMLSQFETRGLMRPNGAAMPDGDAWDAYVWVDGVDDLAAEFTSRGVTLARGLCDQPYGCRDFDVIDCNGYRICFGQDTSG